jgi:hypothetical protein
LTLQRREADTQISFLLTTETNIVSDCPAIFEESDDNAPASGAEIGIFTPQRQQLNSEPTVNSCTGKFGRGYPGEFR